MNGGDLAVKPQSHRGTQANPVQTSQGRMCETGGWISFKKETGAAHIASSL